MPPLPDLSQFEWLVLGEPCSVNGLTTDELWSQIQEYQTQAPAHWPKTSQTKAMLDSALAKLGALGLVRSLSLEGAPLWLRTTEGDLTYNWKKQLDWPDPGPEPRAGETGHKKSAEPCDHFRPFRPAPGYCWCGWFRSEHAPDAQQPKGVNP
ncbi:MAG: hypothetical protein CMLOHMNK_03347 [Steroidobacteraceae bacterium]|nr:hypothetical protein [Steroidobacteraceae bacterium]